jgi:hypothetical protein
MASTDQQNQHERKPEGGEQQGQGTGAAPAATPGLEAVKRAAAGNEADPAHIVGIIRSYPAERDEIMTWLHQHRGNQFVQQVTAAMGQVEGKAPDSIDVQAVRASLMIPARHLAGGYWDGYSVKTTQPTQLGVEVTHTGVRVWVSPGMFIDADWPLQDCELYGANMQFGSAAPHVDVNDVGGLGSGMISVAGRVRNKVSGMLTKAVGHTKPFTGKYDPMQDQDLQGTLNSVLAGFEEMFAEGGGDKKGKDAEAPVKPEEMTRVSAGATVAARAPQLFAQGGSGLSIEGGAPISIDVDGAGNVKQLADAAKTGDPQREANAANVQSVHVSSQGLIVQVKGKPVARIEEITLSRGGKITIDRMEPLGKLKDAELTESGLSLLAALVALHGGSSSTNDLYNNAQHPAVVDGVSRGMIEKEFTDMVHKLILDYRGIVPGLDLATSLGIQ